MAAQVVSTPERPSILASWGFQLPCWAGALRQGLSKGSSDLLNFRALPQVPLCCSELHRPLERTPLEKWNSADTVNSTARSEPSQDPSEFWGGDFSSFYTQINLSNPLSTVLFATGYMHEKCHTSNIKNNWKKYSVLNFNMSLQEKLYSLCIKKNGNSQLTSFLMVKTKSIPSSIRTKTWVSIVTISTQHSFRRLSQGGQKWKEFKLEKK